MAPVCNGSTRTTAALRWVVFAGDTVVAAVVTDVRELPLRKLRR
jgi:hypothetical protein